LRFDDVLALSVLVTNLGTTMRDQLAPWTAARGRQV
jgi:hypothetical protein